LEVIFAKRLDVLIKEWLREFVKFHELEDGTGAKWIE